MPGKILAYSASGTLLWTTPYTPTGDWPRLSLGHDGNLYFALSGKIGMLDATGKIRWERTDISRYSGLLVRRDGALVVGAHSIVRTDGISVEFRGSGDLFGFLGPRDEIVSTTTYDGGTTIDRDGTLVAVNPDSRYDRPSLMLSDGTVVSDRLRVEPFMGTGSRYLPSPGGGSPIAVLEGDRILFLGDPYANVSIIDREGNVLARSILAGGRNYMVGPGARIIGGMKVAAYYCDWPLSKTPWPAIAADWRNTLRAPDNFTLSVGAPKSVAIRGRADPSNLYSPNLPYQFGTLQGYMGYSAKLTAQIDGSGPFTYRWWKNGQELSNVASSEISFSSLSASDAGDYKLSVTNDAGTVYSEIFSLKIAPPVTATPGTYVRSWTEPNSTTPTTCLFTIGADRRAEIVLFANSGMYARGNLMPDGSFRLSNLSRDLNGTFTGTTLTLGTSGPLAEPSNGVTGYAPNGIPAGVYRGHALGPIGYPVMMVVFADGTFSWHEGSMNGYSRAGSGSFASGSMDATLNEFIFFTTSTFSVHASSDGTIVGTRTGVAVDPERFFAVSINRPRVERLANISTRGFVSPTAPPMIAGLIVEGSSPHAVLLRAAGPALAPLGVQQPLGKPVLQLMDGFGMELRRNQSWETSPEANAIRDVSARLLAFPFGTGSSDSAILSNVAPGASTLLVSSGDGSSGVALVEVYEDASFGTTSRLRNLSTRGTVGQGERVLIGGFVVEGVSPKSMLIRAAGPALKPLVGGAFNVASDPRVRIYRSGQQNPLATNDNVWSGSNEREVAEAARRVNAFPFAQGSLDAAMVIALEPGAYTAVVDNVQSDEGVALLEIYEIPAQ